MSEYDYLSDDEKRARPPQNMAEYARRFALNEGMTGYGIGNVYVHLPCPFCAAKAFIVYEIMDVENAMSKGARCKECVRSAKAIYTRGPGSLSFEIVQEHGPDQPEWLVPKMRRL